MKKFEMITSWDGLKLNLCREIPDNPRAIAVMTHGVGLHLGNFDSYVENLYNANIGVYRYDVRGFGDSEGKRAYFKSIFDPVEDLKQIVELAEAENPNLPIFVVGHSMGSHISAIYGTKYPGTVNGFLLNGSVVRYNLAFAGYLPLREDPEKEYRLADALFDSMKQPGKEDIEAALNMDPKCTLTVSVALLNALQEGFEYLRANPLKFVDPILLTHGGADALVLPKDAIDFYQEIGSVDKSLYIYGGLPHGPWRSPAGDMVLGNIVNWIEHRI